MRLWCGVRATAPLKRTTKRVARLVPRVRRQQKLAVEPLDRSRISGLRSTRAVGLKSCCERRPRLVIAARPAGLLLVVPSNLFSPICRRGIRIVRAGSRACAAQFAAQAGQLVRPPYEE